MVTMVTTCNECYTSSVVVNVLMNCVNFCFNSEVNTMLYLPNVCVTAPTQGATVQCWVNAESTSTRLTQQSPNADPTSDQLGSHSSDATIDGL